MRTILFSLPMLSVLTGFAVLAAFALAAAARGPLQVLPSNPRYFTDGSGKAVFLTGAHTWNNLQEIARLPDRPNPTVDFDEYLRFLEERRLNCFRLWTWESPSELNARGEIRYRYSPMPLLRTAPGLALDGEPKFDLTKFNPEYFARVRARVLAARDRGMYVIVMLFQGFSIIEKGHDDPWRGHPFNAANNANGVDGDPGRTGKGLATHTLAVPAVTAVQEAYVRRVIDTVNDLDNVLYEITNEDDGGPENTEWQYHMIRFIKQYEARKPRQHPVGMTVQWPVGKDTPPGGANQVLFESPADWISPNHEGGYQFDPPVADGSKVIVNDTDHSAFFTVLQSVGIAGLRAWAWKSFTRGQHTLFMDPYLDPAPWYVLTRNGPQGSRPDPYYDILRINMGYTRMYADRMDLAAMTPQPALASSGFCLASTAPGKAEYLVYVPQGPCLTVDLSPVAGQLSVEWFSPSTGATVAGGSVEGGAARALTAPFGGDSVLYLAGA
jgi:hypothetical protein